MRARRRPPPPWLLGNGKSCPKINNYKWELYNIAEDFSQSNDLAAKNPDKLKEFAGVVPVRGGKIPGLAAGTIRSCPRITTPRPSATRRPN